MAESGWGASKWVPLSPGARGFAHPERIGVTQLKTEDIPGDVNSEQMKVNWVYVLNVFGSFWCMEDAV